MMRVRLLTQSLELVLDRVIPRDLPPRVITLGGQRYLRDGSASTGEGMLTADYVEELTYAMEAP